MPLSTAIVSTPSQAHESHLGSRCPPEDLRTHTSHSPAIEQQTDDATDVDHAFNAPAQLPTPPPTERDPPPHSLSPPESHTKPSEMRIEGPIRDIPTPLSTTDDGAEERRIAQASPLSATAPSPVPWSQQKFLASPSPSYRVCITPSVGIRRARTRPCC
jgi:hypothetical protein